MNEWFVGYYNPEPGFDKYRGGEGRKLIYLPSEGREMEERQYTCLVKWKVKNGHTSTLSIVELQLHPQFPEVTATAIELPVHLTSQMPLEDIALQDRPGWLNLTEVIEFAIFGQQVIRDGNPVPLETIAHQFFDVRHLFSLPHLPEQDYFTHGNKFRPWFGEAELLSNPELRRTAFRSPILLDCTCYFPGANNENIKQAFLDKGYEELERTKVPEKPGQFRLLPHAKEASQVHVWLKPNVYPYSFVGLAKPRIEEVARKCDAPDEALVLFAVGGKPGQYGLTLHEAVEVLRTEIPTIPLIGRESKTEKPIRIHYEIRDALLMDEGYDVFQFAPSEEGTSDFRVPIVGAQLPEEVPEPATLGRDRIKAVLIVAEKKPNRR